MKFIFNISQVKPILADSMQSKRHMHLYGVESLKTNVPGLWLCLDPSSCFLQSNAVKPRRKPDGSVWRVYAVGCEPGGGYSGDGRVELVPAPVMAAGIERAKALGRDTLTVQIGSTISVVV